MFRECGEQPVPSDFAAPVDYESGQQPAARRGIAPSGNRESLGLFAFCSPILRGVAAEYVEMHARSAFSFLEGASLPEDLASRCAELGQRAMAVTDTHGVYGAPRFHLAA